MAEQTDRGFGRLLIAVYAVFSVAAGARAAVQIVVKLAEAPIAYLLSAFAATIYIVATIGLVQAGRPSGRGSGMPGRWLAIAACGVELLGVLVVGALSVLDPGSFPDETVWSGFGRGYLFIPLALPAVALWWLALTGRRARRVERTVPRP